MKKFSSILILFLIGNMAFAQSNISWISDRPAQTLSAFTPGNNVLVLQAGGAYNYYSHLEIDSFADNYMTDFMLRYGLGNNFELNAQINYDYNQTLVNDQNRQISGVSGLNLGFRYNIINNSKKHWVPSFAVLTQLKMNVYEGDYGLDYFAPKVTLILHKNILEKLSMQSNLGMEWNGRNAVPTTFYTLLMNYNITQKFSFFIENYCTIVEKKIENKFDAGFAFMPNESFLIDINAGFGRNENVDDFLVGAGISFLINKGK